ncbi:MAG: BMP family ABC transporter substrate-binding protein [Chloroflexi bacterium]|nr:BMP family ABC transporter substrate-binding protein [Chloroflexota bacterium]
MPRLRFLTALLVLALTLVACSTPTATAPTVKPAEPAKPAAPASPAAAAPASSPAASAATASPAASAGASPAAAAASPAASPAAVSPPASGKRLRVGLVTDVGKVDDKSFNQSAWEGVQRVQRELGAEVKFLETTDPKDYAKNIDQFAQDGYDVIVTVGFAIGQATQEAAAKYKNVKFIGVDQFQQNTTDNLAGLIFDEDKAGYLAGALAGLLTRTNVVAGVLGTDLVPPVVKFGKGYEAGAKAVKPEIRVIMAYHPGGLARGFSDPDWGKNTTVQMIQQQADVIFGAGGNTGNGALLGATERNVLAIGVDTDQWETLPQVRPVLVSSAMKLITPGVFDLVKSVQDGTFKSGNQTGQVGLAPFHDNASKVPDAAQARLKEIDAGLKSGAVRTGVTLP